MGVAGRRNQRARWFRGRPAGRNCSSLVLDVTGPINRPAALGMEMITPAYWPRRPRMPHAPDKNLRLYSGSRSRRFSARPATRLLPGKTTSCPPPPTFRTLGGSNLKTSKNPPPGDRTYSRPAPRPSIHRRAVRQIGRLACSAGLLFNRNRSLRLRATLIRDDGAIISTPPRAGSLSQRTEEPRASHRRASGFAAYLNFRPRQVDIRPHNGLPPPAPVHEKSAGDTIWAPSC